MRELKNLYRKQCKQILNWLDMIEVESIVGGSSGQQLKTIKRLVRAPSSLFINFRVPHHQVESKQSKVAYDTRRMTNSRANTQNLWQPATRQAIENRTVL